MSQVAGSLVALVTGSTRGIGLAIAKRLARDGYRIALNYRSNDEQGGAALEAVHSHSGESILVKADVTSESGAAKLIGAAMDSFSRIDVLINNVGPFLIRGISEMSVEEWRHMIDGNLTSVFLCSRLAIPLMRSQGGGHIINIGTAKAGSASAVGAYGIAKTGAVMLAKYIAKTEGKYGIRANAINPGFIRTDEYTDETAAEMEAKVPLGRLGTPDDVAATVSFLLSDDASYINGAVIDVGGGLWV